MGQRKPFKYLADRKSQDPEEERLREALSRQAEAFMRTLDASIKLREADQFTSRMRNKSRASVQDACLHAMEAFALSKE